MHPATLPVDELLAAVEESHTRRSGPGGQHRNKTQTAVVLRHRPTGVAAEASERRSQAENRRVALWRLRLALALEHRTPARPAPSALWRSRTRAARLVIAADHADYPALVAEGLDQLEAHGWRMTAAAAALGVTASQLAALFRRQAGAWTTLNRQRLAAGLTPLR